MVMRYVVPRRGGLRESHKQQEEKDTWYKNHSQNRCFQAFAKLRRVCFPICGRAFQSLEAELEKIRKPNCFLVCFSAALGISRLGFDDERRGRV